MQLIYRDQFADDELKSYHAKAALRLAMLRSAGGAGQHVSLDDISYHLQQGGWKRQDQFLFTSAGNLPDSQQTVATFWTVLAQNIFRTDTDGDVDVMQTTRAVDFCLQQVAPDDVAAAWEEEIGVSREVFVTQAEITPAVETQTAIELPAAEISTVSEDISAVTPIAEIYALADAIDFRSVAADVLNEIEPVADVVELIVPPQRPDYPHALGNVETGAVIVIPEFDEAVAESLNERAIVQLAVESLNSERKVETSLPALEWVIAQHSQHAEAPLTFAQPTETLPVAAQTVGTFWQTYADHCLAKEIHAPVASVENQVVINKLYQKAGYEGTDHRLQQGGVDVVAFWQQHKPVQQTPLTAFAGVLGGDIAVQSSTIISEPAAVVPIAVTVKAPVVEQVRSVRPRTAAVYQQPKAAALTQPTAAPQIATPIVATPVKAPRAVQPTVAAKTKAPLKAAPVTTQPLPIARSARPVRASSLIGLRADIQQAPQKAATPTQKSIAKPAVKSAPRAVPTLSDVKLDRAFNQISALTKALQQPMQHKPAQQRTLPATRRKTTRPVRAASLIAPISAVKASTLPWIKAKAPLGVTMSIKGADRVTGIQPARKVTFNVMSLKGAKINTARPTRITLRRLFERKLELGQLKQKIA